MIGLLIAFALGILVGAAIMALKIGVFD